MSLFWWFFGHAWLSIRKWHNGWAVRLPMYFTERLGFLLGFKIQNLVVVFSPIEILFLFLVKCRTNKPNRRAWKTFHNHQWVIYVFSCHVNDMEFAFSPGLPLLTVESNSLTVDLYKSCWLAIHPRFLYAGTVFGPMRSGSSQHQANGFLHTSK